ncbi:MAG: alpha/beta hydrolase [Acidimicrobiales bacterium]
MVDEVVHTLGDRTYRVFGLEAKSSEIHGAYREMDELIVARLSAAKKAVERWRGPHAVRYVDEVNGVLAGMAALKVALWRAMNTLDRFPEQEASRASSRHEDEMVMGARVEAEIEPGTVSAETAMLRAYTTTAASQDGRFAVLAKAVNLDGVRAEVTYQRPLDLGERQSALDAGNEPADLVGATTSETDPVGVGNLISLPDPGQDVPSLVAASRQLAVFTLGVSVAIDNADQATLAMLARDPWALNHQLDWLRRDPRRWAGLTRAQQQLLIQTFPDQIGSIDGIPIMARDQANRIVLQRSRAALEARLALLRRMRSSSNVTPHGSGPGGPNPEEIRQIEEKLAGIAAIENRLRTVPGRPQAYLVGFSADGNGRAIVAIGNPDTAANVATYVPGTGARLGTIGGDIRRADIMVADAGAAPGGTAVITWIGYDAPQQVSRIGHPGSPSAMSPSYAANAAAALRSFQAGLDISHTGGGDFNKTVLGHSYGTTVVGHAARGGGFSADNLVFVASPGVGETSTRLPTCASTAASTPPGQPTTRSR